MTPLKLPLQLLVSLRRRELVNFLSGGHPDLVAKKPCCKDDLAMEFIKTLLCSLNSDFALHLDTSAGFPHLPEGGEGQQALAEDTLIILGGASHAERLAIALGLRHSNVADLTLPGWRLTEETAEDLASDISGILRSHDHEKIILVLQVFDNAIFRGLIGDELCDPIKINGKYHIPGKLVIIRQEELKRLFGMATKITVSVPPKQCRFTSSALCTLYRYVTGHCCRDTSHVSNYSDPDFAEQDGQLYPVNQQTAEKPGVAPTLEKHPGSQPRCPHGDRRCQLPLCGRSRCTVGRPAKALGPGSGPPGERSLQTACGNVAVQNGGEK